MSNRKPSELGTSSTQSDPDEPVRLRPKQIARRYGVSDQTVYDAIYRGELIASRFGERIWLIRPEDAEKWVEENSVSNVA